MSLEDLTTDQLIARARETEASHNLLQSLMKDPASREILQRQLKKANPTLSIPEIDTKDALLAELQEERKARLKLEEDVRKDQIRARLEREKANARDKYKLTDAEMLEVEKLMTAEQDPIPTYEAAARVFAASKQTATPTPRTFNAPTFEMPEKDVWAAGIGNKARLDKIAMDEAFRALNDIHAGKVPGLGPATTH
jgi:hypothetical protein